LHQKLIKVLPTIKLKIIPFLLLHQLAKNSKVANKEKNIKDEEKNNNSSDEEIIFLFQSL
jgi:hypothetical protein